MRTVSDRQVSYSEEWHPGDVILDLYEVKGVLGEGGMGKVYRVRHREWGLDLAMKSPRPDVLIGKEIFKREAETWIRLGLHPHIVCCYYVRIVTEMPCVFVECVDGGSLSDWISTQRLYRGGPSLALERILDVAIQFAWGLHYAHEQGVVHQDVKPGNVMMSPEGVAKVTDFGLARTRADTSGVSLRREGAGESVIVPGAGLMTPAYASPEQAAGQSLTRRSDIWSWGVSLLEMFTGELFWTYGACINESLDDYLNASAPAGLPRMPDEVVGLVRRCFSLDHTARPATMKEVADELRAAYARAAGRTYPRQEPQGGRGTADSLNNRALSYLDLGKVREAEETWRAALATNPNHSETVYNLGILRWRRGEISDVELIQQLKSVGALHESKWKEEYLLALVHLERGDVNSATALLQGALEKAPESVEVQNALQAVLTGAVNSHTAQRTLHAHTTPVAAFTRANGREVLAVGADGFTESWGDEPSRLLRTFGHAFPVAFASADKAGRMLLAGTHHGGAFLWDAPSGELLEDFSRRWYERVLTLWMTEARGRSAPGCLLGSLKWAFLLSAYWCVSLTSGTLAAMVTHMLGVPDMVTFLLVFTFSQAAFMALPLHFKLKRFLRLRFISKRGHMRFIAAAALSGDGKRVLSWSFDKDIDYETLRYWEVESGRPLLTLGERTGSEDPPAEEERGRGRQFLHYVWVFIACCIVPWYYIYLLYKKYKGVKKPGALRPDGAPSSPSPVTSLCLGEDSRLALAGGADGRLRLYDLERGGLVQDLRGHGGAVNAVALSPDGRYALSGGADGVMRLWDVSTGRGLRTFAGHASGVTCVSFDDSGRYAASGSLDTTVRLWHIETGRCLRTCVGHAGYVISVGASGDGSFVSTAASDGVLRFWEVTGGNPKLLPQQVSRVHSPQDLIEMENRADVLVWRAEESIDKGDFVESLALIREVRQMSDFERGQRYLDLWERLSLHCLRAGLRGAWLVKTLGPLTGAVSSVGLSSDGRVAISGNVTEFAGGDSRLRLWDVTAGLCSQSFETAESVSAACVAADGRRAFFGSADGSLHFLNLETGEVQQTLEGHMDAVVSVCISSDGRLAASCSTDSKLRLWETETGRCLRTIVSRDSGPLQSVSVGAEGLRVLTGGAGGALRLWEPGTGRCTVTINGRERPVRTVCISDDGRFAIAGSGEGVLSYWNLEAEECVGRFEGHAGAVTSVCLTPDGRFALSGGVDGTIKLWETWSGNCLHTLDGHEGGVTSLSLDAGGRHMLSGGNDKMLRLWELDWELEARPSADWDDGARRYLENFLASHIHSSGGSPPKIEPSQKTAGQASTLAGRPVWTEQDFQSLLRRLQHAGYGWLKSEGVKRELLALAGAERGTPEALFRLSLLTNLVPSLPTYFLILKTSLKPYFLLIALVTLSVLSLLVFLTLFY